MNNHIVPHEFFLDIMEMLYSHSFSTYYPSLKRELLKRSESSSHQVLYLTLLKHFLWMEECQMVFDIAEYDLHYIKISDFRLRTKDVFTCTLKVVGSNENRPKIVMGDTIRLRVVEEDIISFPFELRGVIQGYDLRSEKATCIFQCSFAETCQFLRFHVRFTFDHCGFRLLHEGIDCVLKSSRFSSRVFPNETLFNTIVKNHHFSTKRRSFSNLASLNEDQLSSINHILDLCAPENSVFNSQPYIIFGPPGTGKTHVIVAAINSILEEYPSKTILAVAPSDAAADVILSRLASNMSPHTLLRLNWWQRAITSVPTYTLPYCLQAQDKFELPSYEGILKYRVVVTTCGVAGCLSHLPNSSCGVEFDVVMIDEASHSPEYESYTPLSLCKPSGLMILAGDVQQLGPIYRSPCFRTSDVHSSLQSRLLSTEVYKFLDTKISDDETLTKETRQFSISGPSSANSKPRSNKILGIFLYRNYRSHQSILDVSSRLFYAGALQQCGDASLVNSLVSWSNLPKDGNFPVLVHGVNGIQKSQPNSPSFYNIAEAETVLSICQSILNDQGLKQRVLVADIGVIAAFRSQVLFIRQRLRTANLSAVNVGSVEDFQGLSLFWETLNDSIP